ncbi:MAG: UDP-glucose 4-epimerase GalE, partial [Clostridia bacterium]
EEVAKITGKKVKAYKQDLRDKEKTLEIFEKEKVDAVIHFAGFKGVGESVTIPVEYYDNNINSMISVIQAMKATNVRNLVFSSSATVYGSPKSVPIDETFETGGTTNPYGTTKLFIERILMDLCDVDKNFNVALLRYFNPIGAHKSGLIGEVPNGTPNNLVPYISQVAVGMRDKLFVYGDDYKTHDGTGVRDYIHVVDLAKGHIKAIEKLKSNCGLVIYNLGTGNGYSVFEVIHAYEKACGFTIPYEVCPRRAGDIAECYSNPEKAAKELGWRAELGIDEMCADSYLFQRNHPDGYKE